MIYEQQFLISLFITLIVEISTLILLLKFVFKDKLNNIKNITFVGLIASTSTLPYFWFVLPFYISNRNSYIIIGEILIIFIETIIYNQFLKLRLSKAFIVSLIANIASIFLGLIIQ